MSEERPRYLAYLLRLWQVGDAREATWRASIESPHSGEQRWFVDLEALFEFLEETTKSPHQHSRQAENGTEGGG